MKWTLNCQPPALSFNPCYHKKMIWKTNFKKIVLIQKSLNSIPMFSIFQFYSIFSLFIHICLEKH